MLKLVVVVVFWYYVEVFKLNVRNPTVWTLKIYTIKKSKF